MLKLRRTGCHIIGSTDLWPISISISTCILICRKRRRNERQGNGHVGHERGTDVQRGTNEGSAKNDNCFVEDKKHRKRRNKGGCREDDVDDDSYDSNRPNDQK